MTRLMSTLVAMLLILQVFVGVDTQTDFRISD